VNPPATTPRPARPSALHREVLAWYDEHARDLPWRAPDATPWGVLVSEVMLQQTPVARVLPAWTAWLSRWPAPSDLAAASPADVLRAWDRLGYPRRALRLQQTAKALVERHGGRVPDDHDALLALPGVGGYTAAAVRAFAFGRRAAVVDTNVRRVHARLVGGTALPAPALTAAETRRAHDLLPPDEPTAARWSVAVMELGALVCTARSPRCGTCPVRRRCAWVAAGSPPHDGPARRVQGFEGTDRQVRGRVMRVLRDASGPVPLAALTDATPDGDRLQRCLDSLLDDGLVVPAGEGFALPGELPDEREVPA
jgi:A/G-specific adenine glycosylase